MAVNKGRVKCHWMIYLDVSHIFLLIGMKLEKHERGCGEVQLVRGIGR